MQAKCGEAVAAALGRPLDQSERKGIDARIRLERVLLARKGGDEWRRMSGTQQLRAAAEAAAGKMIADVAKAKQRVGLMVPIFDRIENELNRGPQPTAKNPTARQDAISRRLAPDTGKAGGLSIESSAFAQEKMALGRLRSVLQASHPKFLGLLEDKQGMSDLMHEIYGEDTGNAVAKAAAKAWKENADEMRDRFNTVGGDIGKLGEHYFPQNHEPYRVGNAKLPAWTQFLMPLLDRDKYLQPDGTRKTDAEVKDFLGHAFDNIINDGKPTYADLQAPQPDMLTPNLFRKTQSGYALYADRNAQHRQIFF